MNISSILRSRKDKNSILKLPSKDNTPERTIQSGEYVSLFIEAINIAHTRVGFDSFYGVVYVDVSISSEKLPQNKEKIFRSPEGLKKHDKNNPSNIIMGRSRVINSIPYDGGDIEIEIGIFSVRNSDLAGPYISMIEEMNIELGSISGFSSLSKLFDVVNGGVRLLLGTTGAVNLEVGISNTFSEPTASKFAIYGKSPDETSGRSITLSENFCLVDENYKEIKDVPYLVFSLESSSKRADWYKINGIKEAYEYLNKEIDTDEYDRIKYAEEKLYREIEKSRELFTSDAIRLKEMLQKKFDERRKVFSLQAQGEESIGPNLPELSSFPLFDK